MGCAPWAPSPASWAAAPMSGSGSRCSRACGGKPRSVSGERTGGAEMDTRLDMCGWPGCMAERAAENGSLSAASGPGASTDRALPIPVQGFRVQRFRAQQHVADAV